MVFAVPVEGGEHDGEDGGGVVADQAHDVPDDDVHDAHMTVLQFIQLLWKLNIVCNYKEPTYSLFQ